MFTGIRSFDSLSLVKTQDFMDDRATMFDESFHGIMGIEDGFDEHDTDVRDPHVELYDHYIMIRGGCHGIGRSDIARASWLWKRYHPHGAAVMSFEDLINRAAMFRKIAAAG